MNCLKCSTVNPQGARFCLNCGAALQPTCSNCGASLQPEARFCHACGFAAQAPAPAVSPAPPAPAANLLQRYIPKELLAKLESARSGGLMQGERRIVTILFCDVQGSTLAASRLDPEEWAEIINGAFEFMIQPVYRYEGTVARLQGDGLLAFFGAPIAHEDDPERAALAGLEIIAALSPYREQVKRQWELDFNVRVGINTGLVVVGEVGSDLRVEYTALGDAINIAARMEQNAIPNTVLLAEPSYRLVAPLFEVEPVPGLLLKGRQEPVTAYRLLNRKSQRGSQRGLAGLSAPLIGRQDHMAALQSAAGQVLKGSGQIVSLIGEAGLGKSRLAAEFRKQLDGTTSEGLQWLEGRTLSYDATVPFVSFTNLLSSYFDLQSAESDRMRYRQLTSRITALFGERGEEVAPFVASMLGLPVEGDAAERVRFLSPQQLRAGIFAQAGRLLERVAAIGPTVLYLDDLHWADPTSIELLLSLLPLVERCPLLVLAAFRPRRQERSWEFHAHAEREFSHRYQALQLAPLDHAQARQLVSSLLQIDDLPEKVRQKILDKSEGNPFFVEEVIRSLLDNRLVVRVDDRWVATREIETIELPDTLVGVITARLDRLEDSTRHILQTASVLGREFSADILAAIVETPEILEDCLVELQRRELVREKARFPQRLYSFKHVLTQEAAYGSILLSSRRELHRRAAGALIEFSPEAAADIARHLLEARQAARAVPYLVLAGEAAARAYANGEAQDFFKQVLAHQQVVGDLSLLQRAYEGLGNTLVFTSEIEQALNTFHDMEAQADLSGSTSMKISALNNLASITGLHLGQFQPAELLLQQAEQLSRRSNELSAIPFTNLIRCQMCTAQGDFENVVKFMGDVVAIGRQLNRPAYIAQGLEHVASSLVYMLQFDEARRRAEEGLAVAREIGDREHEAWLLSMAIPLIELHAGNPQAAVEALEQGLRIGTKIGSLEAEGIAAYMLADIARRRGEYELALSCGHRSLEVMLPAEEYLPFFLVPVLGCLGSIYQEISPQFVDEIGRFHLHALRLLESPFAAMTGAVAWADLGFCAIAMGDRQLAGQVLQKGLSTPNTWSQLERPRHLAGLAWLASDRGEHAQAIRLAEESLAYVQQHALRYHQPLVLFVSGKVLAAGGQLEAGMACLEQSLEGARHFNFRPLIVSAHTAAAQALAAAGRLEQADIQRHAARQMVAEIAGLFEKPDLREIYLRSALGNTH